MKSPLSQQWGSWGQCWGYYLLCFPTICPSLTESNAWLLLFQAPAIRFWVKSFYLLNSWFHIYHTGVLLPILSALVYLWQMLMKSVCDAAPILKCKKFSKNSRLFHNSWQQSVAWPDMRLLVVFVYLSINIIHLAVEVWMCLIMEYCPDSRGNIT